MTMKTDVDKALKDPSLVYKTPMEVLQDPSLNDEQRLEILQRWEQDERELQVAQEEGMAGGEKSILDDILQAMDKLGLPVKTTEVPTKHGGSID